MEKHPRRYRVQSPSTSGLGHKSIYINQVNLGKIFQIQSWYKEFKELIFLHFSFQLCFWSITFILSCQIKAKMPDTLEAVQHILAVASTCDKTFKGHTGYHQTNIMCKKHKKLRLSNTVCRQLVWHSENSQYCRTKVARGF